MIGNLNTIKKTKASQYNYEDEDEIDEMIEAEQEALEEKLEHRKTMRLIEQKRQELIKLERLNELLDCNSYEEAMESAQTEEEKQFIKDNY